MKGWSATLFKIIGIVFLKLFMVQFPQRELMLVSMKTLENARSKMKIFMGFWQV